MPPYLIAFVISEFDVIQRRASGNNVLLRIFGIPQQIPNAAFALDTTERAMAMLENEFSFETQYGFDKLDQVALPVFNQCVTVNYGIAIFNENCLLYEQTVSSFIGFMIAYWRALEFNFVNINENLKIND